MTYLAAAGVDPRAQIKEWEAELGNAYPLIIGTERFGAEKMKLTKVDTSDILLTNSGKFLRATVGITLEEYSAGKTSKLLNGSTGSGNSAKDEILAQVAAMNATPSKEDKAAKKTTNTAYSVK